MDPVTLVIVPGFVGGLLLAAIVVFLQRRDHAQPSVIVPIRLPITTDVVNMAHIKVAGIGGLGLVAMAGAVAYDVPRIGQTIALAFSSGLVGAAVMIAWRRRTSPLPSSGQHMGANSVLSIDEQDG